MHAYNLLYSSPPPLPAKKKISKNIVANKQQNLNYLFYFNSKQIRINHSRNILLYGNASKIGLTISLKVSPILLSKSGFSSWKMSCQLSFITWFTACEMTLSFTSSWILTLIFFRLKLILTSWTSKYSAPLRFTTLAMICTSPKTPPRKTETGFIGKSWSNMLTKCKIPYVKSNWWCRGHVSAHWKTSLLSCNWIPNEWLAHDISFEISSCVDPSPSLYNEGASLKSNAKKGFNLTEVTLSRVLPVPLAHKPLCWYCECWCWLVHFDFASEIRWVYL